MQKSNGIDVDKLRANLASWMKRNGWTSYSVNTALNRLHMVAPKAERIDSFLRGECVPVSKHLKSLDRFIAQYPQPGHLDGFRAFLDDKAREAALIKGQRLMRRRDEAEDRRREHVRRQLAAERGPRTRPSRGPLYGLDKATIAALSGGAL